jgi:hypothetical protein
MVCTGYDPAEADIALASPALLRLPAHSAESKNSLPFGLVVISVPKVTLWNLLYFNWLFDPL